MVNEATGKTRGRPKTKEYKTLLSRVPQDLAELADRYAKQHGQSISELIREGLEWRIGDGDPRSNGMYLAEPMGIRENVYDSNTEISPSVPGQDVLQEVRTLLARQWEQFQTWAQAFEQQRAAAQSNVYSSNTGNMSVVGANDGEAGVVEYDREKFKLGKLCKGGHEFGHTGQTLLTINRSGCLPCRAAQERERQRAKREVQPVSG